MPSTPKLTTTEPLTMDPVVGLRIHGKERVYRFAECRNKDGTICIGRTNERQIQIRKDDHVSRLHCVIRKNRAGQYEIIDFHSTNGVKIAEEPPYRRYRKATRHPLSVGMRIKVGRTKLVIVGPDGEPVIAVARISLFGRVAYSIFGSIRFMARRLGISRDQVRKLMHPKKDSEEPDDD